MPVTGQAADELTLPRGMLSSAWVFNEVEGGSRQTTAFIQQLRQLYNRNLRSSREWAQPSDEPCPMYEEEAQGLLTHANEYSSSEEDGTAPVASSSQLPEEPAHAFDLPLSTFDVDGYSVPGSCSFLACGQSFKGTQRLCHTEGRGNTRDDWQVHVSIQGLDLQRGYVCGVMEALNVPQHKAPIVTFWEGELVDNVCHGFYTRKWGASTESDLAHWSRFPGFAPLRPAVQALGSGKCPGLGQQGFLFMRWKERFFVNAGRDCGLTIAGFYYACMDRATGAISGFYYDPSSSPFQQLALQAVSPVTSGFGFGSYELR